MRVAIQGLGESPTTVLMVLDKERPNISHIICSDYQLKYVAKKAGMSRTNEEIINEAARNAGVDIKYHICDVFDPQSVGDVLGEIMSKLNPKTDELVINYTGGTAVVRLLLGTMGVVVSTVMKAKVVYAIKYPGGIEVAKDHTNVLKDIFERLKLTA